MSSVQVLLATVSALSGRLVIVSDGTGFAALPESVWVVPGSAVAVCAGDTLSAVPGSSGARPGLRLDPAPAAGDTVVVTFEKAPLGVPSTAVLDLEILERLPSGFGAAWRQETMAPGLYISGSKRLGISVGEGPGVTQSTRLAISGTVAQGVEVEGSVSDQNLPVGSGSSELVSELDKVLLAVRGESWQARLGDIEWSRPGTGALAWRRELSGADARLESPGSLSAGGGAGVSGQEHARTVFYTLEGVQGPYDVSGGSEIAPGSERVLLDGFPLERGESADYTMDYTTGRITFTPRRLIRRDQRAEVTYYSRGDGFSVDLVSASAGLVTGGVGLEIVGFSEADDRERPLGFALTDEAIEALENAGEDPDSAWVDGAEEVGPGKGSYSLDSLGRFVYEGPGLGDWRVEFDRPPDGPGDYVYDSSIGGFAWVGEGEGTHLPRIYLEIPESLEVAGLRAASPGRDGAISWSVESAVSRRVGNTFDPRETTREGFSTTAGAVLEAWDGAAELSARAVLVSDGFRQPGVWEEDSSLSGWALPPSWERRDDIFEAGMSLSGLSVLGGVRLPSAGGGIGRGRASFFRDVGRLGLAVQASAVHREGVDSLQSGRVHRASAGTTLELGVVDPLAGVELLSESWLDSLEGDRISFRTGAEAASGSSSGRLTLEYALDGRESQVPLPRRIISARLEGSGGGSGWSASGSAEHSVSIFDQGASTVSDAISARASAGSGTTWASASYSGSGVLSRSLEVHYRYVGEGQGSYSYDEETGGYYPDPDGDYEIYYLPGESGDLVAEASLEASLASGGSEGPGLDCSVRLDASGGDDRLRVFLLAGAFGSGDGGYSVEAAPAWRSRSGLLRLLRLRGRIERQARDYSGAGTRRESARLVELSQRLSPAEWLSMELLQRLARSEEELYAERRTDAARVQADPSVTASTSLEPGVLAALEHRSEAFTGLSGNLYELRPHVSLNAWGWSSYSSFGAEVVSAEEPVPLWLFDGKAEGTNLTVGSRVSRRVSRDLEVSLTYNGRRIAGSSWTHRGGLEGTVTF